MYSLIERQVLERWNSCFRQYTTFVFSAAAARYLKARRAFYSAQHRRQPLTFINERRATRIVLFFRT